jgi:hypothetical protein
VVPQLDLTVSPGALDLRAPGVSASTVAAVARHEAGGLAPPVIMHASAPPLR